MSSCVIGCTCGRHKPPTNKPYVRSESHRRLQADIMTQVWADGKKTGSPCPPSCRCAKHQVTGQKCLPGCSCGRHLGFFGGQVGEKFARILSPCGFVREHKIHIGPGAGHHYNLDFAETGLKVNVELDGPGHDASSDSMRDSRLKALGWIVVRIHHE